jgi:hypothetical protein
MSWNGKCWYTFSIGKYFTAIWYILLLFGIFCGRSVSFSRFGMLEQEKSGNPGLKAIALFYMCRQPRIQSCFQQ